MANLGLGLAGGTWAQSTEYLIGVGDVLAVNVWQRPDLGGEVSVDAEGNITVPLVGLVRAAGQTPARLGDELTRRYSFVDREVSQVTVVVREYRSRRVFVIGQVLQPGAYAFAQIPGLWDVIREAGGPTPEAALTRVRVVPPAGGGPPHVIDLEHLLATGDFDLLPPLEAGSTILVPRLEELGVEGDVIHVYGKVATPGVFPIDVAQTALQAVLAAGGPLPGADVSNIRVVRPGAVHARVFQVDLEAYTNGGVLYSNVILLPGDTVTVPGNRNNAVWTAVKEIAGVAGSVLGTIYFFDRLINDED
jgi:polysaccharide export outer membrane protein